jgi:nicotinamide mononucleotide transporter PnuC
MNEKRTCIKKRNLDLALAIMAAILIIVFAFLQKQSVIKTLPTLITLVVQIFMVKANRVAFLVGGANAVLYGFSYYSEGLCFSAISNALISAPIMIFSFFNWKRKAENGNPKLFVLKKRARIIWACVAVVAWVLCAKLFGNVISTGRFVWLDCLCFVGGLAVTLLAAFGYADAQYLNIGCCVVTLAMWIAVCVENPENVNFVIISIYNLYKVTQMAINWTKISKSGGKKNEN